MLESKNNSAKSREASLTKIDFSRYHSRLQSIEPIKLLGTINRAAGLVIESQGPPVRVGDLCDIVGNTTEENSTVEVIGFRDKTVLSRPLGKLQGVKLGTKIIARNKPSTVRVGPKLLGRVLDGLGNPIDNLGPLDYEAEYPLHKEPENPMSRDNITEPLGTGVRTIDSLLTCGKGQRIGIFGGSNNRVHDNRVVQDGYLPDGVTRMGQWSEPFFCGA